MQKSGKTFRCGNMEVESFAPCNAAKLILTKLSEIPNSELHQIEKEIEKLIESLN